jgi:hypothetical protein
VANVSGIGSHEKVDFYPGARTSPNLEPLPIHPTWAPFLAGPSLLTTSLERAPPDFGYLAEGGEFQ